jgi:hypothetical protein
MAAYPPADVSLGRIGELLDCDWFKDTGKDRPPWTSSSGNNF